MILFADETVFSKRAIMKQELSGPNYNLAVDQAEVYTGYACALAAISAKNGVEYYVKTKKGIKSGDYIDFLHNLRIKFGNTPLALFADNLSVHKSKYVKPCYALWDIKPVWNVGYCPEFNPIEAVFSKVKAIYCRQRVNKLVNKLPFDRDEMIDYAIG